MTDSTNRAHDDLDGNWEDSPPASLQSLPPGPELDQLDAGWDRVGAGTPPEAPLAVRSASGIPESGALPKTLESIDEGWDVEHDREPPMEPGSAVQRTPFGKKDRRALERRVRAHQLERTADNREQRKARRRAEAKRRGSERPSPQRAGASEPRPTRDVPAKTKQQRRPSSTENSAPKPTTPIVVNSGPNRAERRSKNRQLPETTPPRPTIVDVPTKKPLVGPFALFMAVVLVASILSYAFIQ